MKMPYYCDLHGTFDPMSAAAPCPQCAANDRGTLGHVEMRAVQLAGEIGELRAYAVTQTALLKRLRAWDMMSHTSDGPYWCREIDAVLATINGEPVAAELTATGSAGAQVGTPFDSASRPDQDAAGSPPYVHEIGKMTLQEHQARAVKDLATTGTARVEDVHAILGDPSKGVTNGACMGCAGYLVAHTCQRDSVHQVNQLAPWCPRCERDYVQSGTAASRWEHPFSERRCRYSGTAVTLRPVACNKQGGASE